MKKSEAKSGGREGKESGVGGSVRFPRLANVVYLLKICNNERAQISIKVYSNKMWSEGILSEGAELCRACTHAKISKQGT